MLSLKYLESIQDFICFNQKKLIEYNYELSEKHKKMKDYYIETIKDKKYNKVNIKILEEKYYSLLDMAFDDIINIFDKNNIKVDNIFKALKKESSPRLVIKSILSDYVLDLYRKNHIAQFRLSKIASNTAFSEIIHNEADFYLKNNLYEEWKKGQYKNNRLIEDCNLKLIEKTSWKKCWKPYEKNENNVVFYNSTLVIPMAIKKDRDDNNIEFNKKYFDNNEKTRAIWGFLCLDHEEENYFNDEEIMKSTGFIIADQLSLYLVYFYNYITISETTTIVSELISDLDKDKKEE